MRVPPTVFLVCGSTGAGKTTYARDLAHERRALCFSIDPWMQTLFAPDMTDLDYAWITERVQRCEAQMWQLAEQALALGTDVVFDSGFFASEHRRAHVVRAEARGARTCLHFVDTPLAERRRRVAERNALRDEHTFAFEVTESMFDFMERRFEVPSEDELRGGCTIDGMRPRITAT